MGDVIQFPQDRRQAEDVLRMKNFADQLDEWILDCVMAGTQPHEISGLMAHRLGSLICHGEDPVVLADFCQNLIRKQLEKVTDQGAS
ncbi:MAG: hypothetical protein AB8C84_05965 [Oligoflexales bacterium]